MGVVEEAPTVPLAAPFLLFILSLLLESLNRASISSKYMDHSDTTYGFFDMASSYLTNDGYVEYASSRYYMAP